ncbi:MAG: hypothetical protein JW852_05850 [Spirochaetales bacterium]|nr:hypothetical protein [Spirochaetales bacterium]
MIDEDNKANRPVEIFCPICGYKVLINEVDEDYAGLPREKKVDYVRTLQKSGHPMFTCTRCENPEQTARFMEVR